MRITVVLHFLLQVKALLIFSPTTALVSPHIKGSPCFLGKSRHHASKREKGLDEVATKTTAELPKGDEGQSDVVFDSLDVVLERARQRNKFGLFIIRAQAMMNAPVVNLGTSFLLTRSDVVFVVLAVALGSTGFAIGLVTGKATTGPLRGWGVLPPNLIQFWPPCLGILLDQLI